MKIPYQMRSTRSTDALNSSTSSRYWPIGNCNVILVGDAKVGKTNLVNRATQDKFNEVSKSLKLNFSLKQHSLSNISLCSENYFSLITIV